ncbi:zinc chelation protein SecC, partial [Acinetobacter baumannii]
IDTLLLSNSTNESHYKVALEEVSKLLENIQEQGDEDLSNFLWKLKTILIIKDRYIKTFFLLKDKKHYEAWVLLERIEIDISFLEKNVDEDFIKKYKLDFYKEIVESWQSLFPYKIFFSIGATIKQYTCSICGHVIRPRNKCIHKKGKLYNGKLCVHVADGGCELKEISMVKNPVQKSCIPMLDYDYSAVDFISERLQSPFDYWKPFKTKKLIDRSEFNTVDENDMCPCKESKKIFKECCFNKEKIEFPHIHIHFSKSPPSNLATSLIKIGRKL